MPIPAVTPVKAPNKAVEVPFAPTKKDAVDEHEPRAAISVSAAERLAMRAAISVSAAERLAKAYINVTAML